MTTYHFGSAVSQASFAEYDAVEVIAADDSSIWVAPRPELVDGVTLTVRDPDTLVALDPITVGDNGYWAYTTTDIPIIQVSSDAGTSWSEHYSREVTLAAATAGVDASTALSAANNAVTTANSAATTAAQALALAQAGTGGGGFTGTVDYATQVTGKPSIPSTAADLGAIATSSKGAANGVASLDASTKIPLGQIPIGTTSSTVAAGDHTHTWGYAQMPPGAMFTVDYNVATSSWPTRPTSRTDLIGIWRAPAGIAPAPAGAGYAVMDVDEFKLKAS